MRFMLLNYTLKNGSNGKFHAMYILPQFLKTENKSREKIYNRKKILMVAGGGGQTPTCQQKLLSVSL